MNSKERTSISIDANLLKEAKRFAAHTSLSEDRRVSFSEVVAKALKEYMTPTEAVDTSTDQTNGVQPYV